MVATVTTWPSFSSIARQRAKPRKSASDLLLHAPLQPAAGNQACRGLRQRHAIGARSLMHGAQRHLADAAPRDVDDALERQIIRRLSQ